MKKLAFVLVVLLLGATIGVAEDRPIWIWGMRSALRRTGRSAIRTERSRRWVTSGSRRSSAFPAFAPRAHGNLQALRALLASWRHAGCHRESGLRHAESVRLLTDLAKDGRLHALDKYFDDPENYPVFASADKGHLRAYRLDGTLYAVPSWVWRIRADDPFSAHPHWMMRLDAYEKYGYATTYDELHELLMNVKNDDFTTINGAPADSARPDDGRQHALAQTGPQPGGRSRLGGRRREAAHAAVGVGGALPPDEVLQHAVARRSDEPRGLPGSGRVRRRIWRQASTRSWPGTAATAAAGIGNPSRRWWTSSVPTMRT